LTMGWHLSIIVNILHKRILMQIVNYSHYRDSLKAIICTACDNSEEITAATTNDKPKQTQDISL